jgi:hypothetical protein
MFPADRSNELSDKLPPEEEMISRVVIRMHATFTGVVLGLLFGLGLFFATIWLVFKGGPRPGVHLMLLGQYFPGYSVTILGSLIGFVYAFAIGFVTGALLGFLYNKFAK